MRGAGGIFAEGVGLIMRVTCLIPNTVGVRFNNSRVEYKTTTNGSGVSRSFAPNKRYNNNKIRIIIKKYREREQTESSDFARLSVSRKSSFILTHALLTVALLVYQHWPFSVHIYACL